MQGLETAAGLLSTKEEREQKKILGNLFQEMLFSEFFFKL